jgi:Skp family chaperone for outer membrane proteins
LTHLHRHAVSLVAALLLSLWAPQLYAQVRIAVVDLQRAISETEDGRRAKARLKRLMKQRQTSLDDAQNQVKALKEEYDRQQKVWRPEVKAQKEAELQKAFVELQQKYGWEAFEKLFAEYRALPDSERPKTDLEKRRQWCERLSRIVGKDLTEDFSFMLGD